MIYNVSVSCLRYGTLKQVHLSFSIKKNAAIATKQGKCITWIAEEYCQEMKRQANMKLKKMKWKLIRYVTVKRNDRTNGRQQNRSSQQLGSDRYWLKAIILSWSKYKNKWSSKTIKRRVCLDCAAGSRQQAAGLPLVLMAAGSYGTVLVQ